MRGLAVLLLLGLAACGGRRREILAIPDLTLCLVFHSTVDQHPDTVPNPHRPPGKWLKSVLFRPGQPVPLFPGHAWVYRYVFDAPQARRAVDALDDAGLLERLVPAAQAPPSPPGRSYTLEFGRYDRVNGGFTAAWIAPLGWGPALRADLQVVRAGLEGEHAKAVDALLADLPE